MIFQHVHYLVQQLCVLIVMIDSFRATSLVWFKQILFVRGDLIHASRYLRFCLQDKTSEMYGTVRQRLGGDAIKDFDCCSLTLQPCVDPVVTPRE